MTLYPNRNIDTIRLEGNQNHNGSELQPAAGYWEKLDKEVRQNEGNHPGRSWEGNQEGLTQNSQHSSGNNQENPVDLHEEPKLVNDLGDDVEMVDEEGETDRLRNKVISELIKEEMGVWMCKAYDYKSIHPVRVRYHIEN